MTDWSKNRYRNRLPLRQKIARFFWGWVWLFLFRPTPRWTLFRWRNFLLRCFGARIGRGSKVRPSCKIWAPWNLEIGQFTALGDRVDCYNVAPLVCGSKVAVSQDAFLCTATHDISSSEFELVFKPITIGNRAWIAARAFVGPGVSVGEGAVVGACAVVAKDVDPWTVVGGNPAVSIKKRDVRGT